MENFRSTYSIFFNELNDFVEHLLTVYRRDEAPTYLQNVKLVPTVLAEDDEDFVRMDKESLCTKTQIVLQATRIVLDKVGPHIRPSVKADFQKESRHLKRRMGAVEMSMSTLAIQSEIPEVSLMFGGISSVNPGVRRCIKNDTYVKLRDMCKKLQ